MKVKEFIEVLKNIKIKTPWKVIEEKSYEFWSGNFNVSCYGHIGSGTFDFAKNRCLVSSFSSLYKLTLDTEIMNMEIISVEKMQISHYVNLSSSGDKYYGNSCKLRFAVK